MVEAIIGAVVLVFEVILFARTVRIVPQARAGIVERLGRYQRTLNPGMTVLMPFVDRLKPLIDLREQVVSFPPQPVITQDNLVVQIDTVLYFTVVDPRSATYEVANPLQAADERPYGGGPGMVLRIEPLARTLDRIVAEAPPGERRKIVLTSASGPVFRQADAAAWAELDRLVLICGHYEGVDERLAALYPVEEVSLGEYVLTGGEIAAMAFLDATVRLVPGAIDPDSAASDSWTAGEPDHPAYTRPPTFRGIDVPAVLLSGDHAKIAEWRREQSRARAAARNRMLDSDI
jgi:tRNA (guanine37-N1)-methyltransferase